MSTSYLSGSLELDVQSLITGPGSDRVLVRNELRAEDISHVANGRALAVLVPDYYGQADCEQLKVALLDAECWTTYSAETGAEGIGTLGDSLFGCLGQELCKAYFESGREMWGLLRRITYPMLFPADRVQLDVDHAWPTGASLLHIGGKPAFYGLVRSFREGGAAMPHTDRADWDFPSVETSRFRAQLFLNVYLSKTTHGGKVRLWDRQPEHAEYEALRYEPDHYALDPGKIGPHAAEIDVPVGALLIANAFRVHEVTSSTGEGVRLSVSGFIGYVDDASPLGMFS